jgi:hypothetical protein
MLYLPYSSIDRKEKSMAIRVVWKDSMYKKIEEMASKGLNDAQIAINLGAHPTTFSHWKRTKPELAMILDRAREPLITEVENALYERAIGFDAEDITIERSRNRKIVKRTKRKVAGDVKAMIFYLTNRAPEKWRFSNRIESVSGKNTDDAVDLSKLSDEQLAALSDIFRQMNEDEEQKEEETEDTEK